MKEVTEQHNGQMGVDLDPSFDPRHALVLGLLAGESPWKGTDLHGRQLPHLMSIKKGTGSLP